MLRKMRQEMNAKLWSRKLKGTDYIGDQVYDVIMQ
jgi:hypothetical protein